MSRQVTPFIQQAADYYNQASPQEQRQLDYKLAQEKAKTLASPQAMFHLFPSLGAKSLKLKDPKK